MQMMLPLEAVDVSADFFRALLLPEPIQSPSVAGGEIFCVTKSVQQHCDTYFFHVLVM